MTTERKTLLQLRHELTEIIRQHADLSKNKNLGKKGILFFGYDLANDTFYVDERPNPEEHAGALTCVVNQLTGTPTIQYAYRQWTGYPALDEAVHAVHSRIGEQIRLEVAA